MKFRNPSNGYTEKVSMFVWLWVLLFGGFYFIVKGVWTHAIAGFLLAFPTCGISWLIYPFSTALNTARTGSISALQLGQ